MSTEIRLPELGDGIESGDVLAVLVEVGDQIDKDQGVIEVETDKATVEVPSSAAGKVAQVHVSVGQTISIGEVLVTLDAVEAESSAPAAAPAPAEPESSSPPPESATEPEPEPEPEPKPESPVAAKPQPPRPATPAPQPSQVDVPPSPVPAPATATSKSTAQTLTTGTGPIPAGPAVRRFAREVGVDLSNVAGSGEGGRITREDVLNVVRQTNKSVAARSAAKQARVPGTPATDAWGVIGLEPMTKIRQTIASKMHESWSSVPRVTNFDDADVTELEKIRQTSKSDYAAAGIKLTAMPFLIKAVAMALRNHTLVNAEIDDQNKQIIYKEYINIGIAVDTDRGLVVPALRRADRLSIADTAKELADLAEKARSSSFTIDDLRGATFTISNLGAIGGTYSTPIVNYPEVAILLVGRSRKMPVVIEDEIKIRLMMPLSLSYDHRLIDGATAARFLNEIIGYLEAPGRLLLAP